MPLVDILVPLQLCRRRLARTPPPGRFCHGNLDVLQQRRLVFLDLQLVVGARLARRRRNLPLATHGVDCDGRAAQVQRTHQVGNRSNLVRFFVNALAAQREAGLDQVR